MVLDRTVDELEQRTDQLVGEASKVTAELEAQTQALLDTWARMRAALELGGDTDDR